MPSRVSYFPQKTQLEIFLIAIILLAESCFISSASTHPIKTQTTTKNINNDKSHKHLARSTQFEPRVIGGNTASKGRYPYVANIIDFDHHEKNSHVCAATLVAPDILLSAAHCTDDIDGIEIGRFNINDPSEVFERFVVERVLTHVKFDGLDYDYAILKLYGTSSHPYVRFNENASIPQQSVEGGNDTSTSSSSSSLLTVVGWGVYMKGYSQLSSVLLEGQVQYISNDQCAQYEGFYGGDYYSYQKQISGASLCAMTEGVDACMGDSGGPLILRDSVRDTPAYDVLVGVVSFGVGCADSFPGVYSRVSTVHRWLKEEICNLSNDPPRELKCNVESRGAPSEEKGLVTVEIQFDQYAYETGWLLRSSEMGTIYASVPIGTYKDKQKGEVIYHTVEVNVDVPCEFVILDWAGDGIFDGYYRIHQSRNESVDVLYVNGSGDFLKSRDYQFYVRGVENEIVVPTLAPTSYSTTGLPTWSPSRVLTTPPSHLPTATPSKLPTPTPANVPALLPSLYPSSVPSQRITTDEPTASTHAPTATTDVPTVATNIPTVVLTSMLTPQDEFPSHAPTEIPTTVPTMVPTNVPTAIPSHRPSSAPPQQTTVTPTAVVLTSMPTPQDASSVATNPPSSITSRPTFIPEPTDSPSSSPHDASSISLTATPTQSQSPTMASNRSDEAGASERKDPSSSGGSISSTSSASCSIRRISSSRTRQLLWNRFTVMIGGVVILVDWIL